MNCDEAQRLISSALDREVSHEERAALDAHIASCASCRSEAEAARAQDTRLREAFGSRRKRAQEVGARAIDALRSEGAAASRPQRTGDLPWLAMALSLAAGFAIASVVFYRPALQETQAPPPANGSTPTGVTLSVAKGRIEALRPGKNEWEAVPSAGFVETGSRVRTGAQARCELRTADGTEVRLNSGTEVLFHTPRRVEIVRGEVLSSVAKAEEPYRVLLPRDEATVTALGTLFNLRAREKETVLTMIEGVTQVTDIQGQEIGRFKVGDQVKIVEGRIEERSQRDNLLLVTGWASEILALKGPDNVEFHKRLDTLLAGIGETKLNVLLEEEIVGLGDHCVLPLVKFIQSQDSRKAPPKRRSAARILDRIAVPWSLELLIQLLSDSDGEVRYWTAKALRRLAGAVNPGPAPEAWRDADPGTLKISVESWQAWWRENKQHFPPQGPGGT